MSERKIIFSGLAESGKTTFIAALWHFVFNGGSLTLNSISGENEYLDTISSDWLSFSPISRNGQVAEQKCVMNLKNTGNNENVILDFPDIQGETFRKHFENREWTEEYNTLLQEISGMLLFVNPQDKKNMPRFSVKENKHFKFFGEVPPDSDQTKVPWNISFVPTQVKLVEILQFTDFYRVKNKPLKLAIIISAWDKVVNTNPNITPDDWLKDHLPLLYQYIICNNQSFQPKFFGVSAQGGDYAKPLELERLEKMKPIERILVVEKGQEDSNDIARPIIWATE